MTFTDQQLATALAALSMWQMALPMCNPPVFSIPDCKELLDIATNYGELRNLDSDGIDDLIHAINND